MAWYNGNKWGMARVSCTKCRLHKTCRSIQIEGRGSAHPDVVFVGQAPGREEDERDKCFVGPAGQLLLQAISSFGLKPAYLTNLVKCFPPSDRDPKADEISACKPYLDEELKRIKPKLVVLLGNIPLKGVLGLTGITNHSGRVVEKDGRRYFPLLHPSFILRYPHNQALFENHLKELKRELKGEEAKHEQTVKFTVKQARQFISTAAELTFDYETTGIDTHTTGKVRCLGLSDGKVGAWVDAQESGFRDLARDLLTGPKTKIAHNSVFERRCSKENFGVYPRHLKWDTYAMHFLLDENSSHALDVLAGKYLDAPAYDIYHQMVEEGHTYATYPIEKIGPYCAKDALYTAKLAILFRKMLKEQNLLTTYKHIMRPLTEVIARMEVRGTYLDLSWQKTLEKSLQAEMFILKEKFIQLNAKRMDKVKLVPNAFNMNSADQMRKLITVGMGIPIFEKTEGGKESVKAEVIEKIKHRHKTLPLYLDWKSKFTQLNNFVQKYPKFCDEKGIIRASINPCHVVTGRLSVTKPPLQAVDTDPRIRGMFSSRFKQGGIASCDFRQLEVRLVASESGEEKLLSAIDKGVDLHALTAALLFGKGFTKEERNEAKRVNFGVVYGITGYALALQINKPEDYSQGLIDKFFDKYPKINVWMEAQKKFLNKNGYIVSRFGRVRRLGDTENLPNWQKEALQRQAGNFPIQSAGADLTNLSLIKLHTEFKDEKMKSIIFMQVHDSILVDVYPGEEKKVEANMKYVMSEHVPSRCPWLRVKLDVDFSLHKRWEGMKNLQEASHG